MHNDNDITALCAVGFGIANYCLATWVAHKRFASRQACWACNVITNRVIYWLTTFMYGLSEHSCMSVSEQMLSLLGMCTPCLSLEAACKFDLPPHVHVLAYDL